MNYSARHPAHPGRHGGPDQRPAVRAHHHELPKYLIRYLGKQQVDEIGCYVFAVKPKKMEGNQRYFSGEVWVDDRDLQIVKSYGRGVGTASKES